MKSIIEAHAKEIAGKVCGTWCMSWKRLMKLKIAKEAAQRSALQLPGTWCIGFWICLDQPFWRGHSMRYLSHTSAPYRKLQLFGVRRAMFAT